MGMGMTTITTMTTIPTTGVTCTDPDSPSPPGWHHPGERAAQLRPVEP